MWLIWLIVSTSGSLWVSWHTHHKELSTTSLWNLVEKQCDSWTWKCLFRLRPLAQRFIKCTIGNGKTASFWFDTWISFGPLINFIGSNGPSTLRIPLTAKVSDTCNDSGWSTTCPVNNNAPTITIWSTWFLWLVCGGFVVSGLFILKDIECDQTIFWYQIMD